MRQDLPDQFRFDLADPVLSIRTFEEIFSFMEIVPLCGAVIRSRQFIINLKHLDFIDPYSLISLILVGQYLKKYCGEVVCELPESFDMLTYFGRAGFFDIVKHHARLASVHPIPEGLRHDGTVTNLLVPMTRVETCGDIQNILQSLAPQKRRKTPVQADRKKYQPPGITDIALILEILGTNIVTHGRDSGYIMAQRYRDSQRRSFIIVGAGDLGIGIKESVKDRPTFSALSDSDILKHLLNPRECEGKKKSGGLHRIKEIVDSFGGRMTIRSGGVRLDYRSKRYQGKAVCFFPGTQVSVRI